MAGFLFVTFYVAMAGAALIVEAIFWIAGLIPSQRNARVVEASIEWNYTTWLNVGFLGVSTRGVICQEMPHLSLHQPHWLSWPPLPTMAFQ
jgi:hypothetical protein